MVFITVDGADELIEFLKEITSEKKADQVLQKLAEKTATKAFELAPEDTGVMENDIRVEKDSEGYKVVCDPRNSSGKDYAIYNEFGTYKMPVGTEENPLAITSTSGKGAYRPFMRPAAYQTLDELDEIINSVFFGKVIGKSG
jgi:HK97 gp10 family phage protein